MTGPSRPQRISLRELDLLQGGASPLHRADPLLKLLLTLLFLLITVSFGKYDLFGLLVLILFPLAFYQYAGLRLGDALHCLRWLLLPVAAVGVFNPVFDRAPLLHFGGFSVSGGVVSGLTLLTKGLLCLMAAFGLLATTPAEDVARALTRLHCPRFLVSLLLLTLRYAGVLAEEARAMADAYALRAPGVRGVRFADWGSFLGRLLLRSLDRAQTVYDSMLLRGFTGALPTAKMRPASGKEQGIALLVACSLLLVRLVNLPALLVGLLLAG